MRQPGDRPPAPPELALAQDLANTVDLEQGVDHLRTTAGLVTFAAEHGLPGLSAGPSDLARFVAFREALRDACQAHAGADLPERSARILNGTLRRVPLVLTIDPTGAAAVAAAPGLRGPDALMAHLAAGIATAVANHTWPRLKACGATTCRWVYFDHSPAARGRWCTMKICGSRAKVRQWRQRQPPR